MMRVQGTGSPTAQLAFIGHRPIPEERELDAFLNGTDLPTRDQVFLTHLACAADWLDLELELNLVRPDILVPLGEPATQALLGTVSLDQLHGTPLQVGCFIVFPVSAPVLPDSPDYAAFACDLIKLGLYLTAPAAILPLSPPARPMRAASTSPTQTALWANP